IGVNSLLKVCISSTTRLIPSGVLKSIVGIPCSMTLCHGSSFWACLNGTICSYIACFSRRKSAENPGVVVTTMFLPRDLDIVATIRPLIPLSRNALLKAFLSWSGKKLVLLLDVDWIRMRRFEVFGLGFGCWPIVGFLLPSVVYSW